MKKNCIFNDKAICSDCGQCETCDLNLNKKCTSCGKCLQMEGIDIKAVRIDEISEEIDSSSSDNAKPLPEDYSTNESSEPVNDVELLVDGYTYENDIEEELYENSDSWELIGDIDGLDEILEETDNHSNLTEELFPGLITIKSNYKK